MMADQSIYNLVLISICVMVALSLGIIILFSVSQRRILAQVREAHDLELAHQQELLQSNIETQERERARIARELHDEIGSKLNVVNLNVNLLKVQTKNSENIDQTIDHINTALSASIARTREISHALIPPILEKFGILSTINNLATQVNRTGAVEVDVNINHEWNIKDSMKELHIYRILQELITNTVKHANATNILISSNQDENHLEITYKDDGKGITNLDDNFSGIGIKNIETRILLLNAEYEIKSTANNGFQFTLNVPINTG